MAAKFYAAQASKALLQIVIVRGKKEIEISLSDGTMKIWNEILLDEKQAYALRSFLEENNWL